MRKNIVIFFIFVLFVSLTMQIFTINSFAAGYSQSELIKAGLAISERLSDSDTSTLSNSTMKKYADAGVFGSACQSASLASSSTTDITNISQCSEAAKYKEKNEVYANYAENGLKSQDKTSNKLTSAMEKFNDNAHFVYSFLCGFGCLTSLLVFILIFIRITWLPEHAIQRRKAMEDILTSGIAVILLGGFWLVIGVFQSIFNRFWESYTVYSKDWLTAGNVFLVEYKNLIIGILGIATLTALLMFIKSITSIIIEGSNPQKKKEKIIQVLYCGLATAGLGGLTIFASFFWNMLK